MWLLIILIIIIFNLDILSYTFCYSISKLLLGFIPYLFIQTIISNLFISYFKIKRPFYWLYRLFHVSNDYSLKIILISPLIGSIPTSRLINRLYEDKIIDYNESLYLLSFCLYINPLFLFSIFKFYGIIIFILSIISNIIISKIYKNKIQIFKKIDQEKRPIIATIIDSTNQFVDSFLRAFGIITLFSYLINIINKYNRLNIIRLLYPILEISNLSLYNSISNLGLILVAFIYSFNGISILMQVNSFLNKDFKFKNLIKYRLLSGIITSILLGGFLIVSSIL